MLFVCLDMLDTGNAFFSIPRSIGFRVRVITSSRILPFWCFYPYESSLNIFLGNKSCEGQDKNKS